MESHLSGGSTNIVNMNGDRVSPCSLPFVYGHGGGISMRDRIVRVAHLVYLFISADVTSWES